MKYEYDIERKEEEQNQQLPESNGPFPVGYRVCLGFLAGAFLGIIASFVLTPIYLGKTQPRVLEDAQWGMVYTLTLPLGAVVGGILGCIIAISARCK